PRTSSDTKKKDSQGSEPEAKTGLRRKQSSKHTSESKLEATKTSFIIHSESASGRDASIDSTAEADPGNSAPYNSLPQQQGRDEGTKTIHLITYLKEREQVRLQKKLKKSALRILNLALIPLLKYSLEDDPNIVVDESEEDDEEVHATSNVELKILQLPNLCLPGPFNFKS
ncbi:hypothetical protein Tco_1486202, partial [Tanacetum coccineum]